MKRVIVSESAGFCFGVKRSVELAETMLSGGGECWSLGQLIHNDDVVHRLREKGLHVAASPEEIPDGARVIIRSHGVGREAYEFLRAKHAEVIDATCPKVSHIHKIAEKASNEGRTVIVIGAADHTEVRGICGWCGESRVFPDAESLEKWLCDNPENRNMLENVHEDHI